MRLAVAAILLSVSLPALAGMADGFADGSSISEAESMAKTIKENASSLYYSGPGSTKNIEVRVPAGYEIRIGGVGAESYSVAVLKDGSAISVEYMQYPSVRFSGCTVITGIVSLSLDCRNIDGECIIGARQI